MSPGEFMLQCDPEEVDDTGHLYREKSFNTNVLVYCRLNRDSPTETYHMSGLSCSRAAPDEILIIEMSLYMTK